LFSFGFLGLYRVLRFGVVTLFFLAPLGAVDAKRALRHIQQAGGLDGPTATAADTKIRILYFVERQAQARQLALARAQRGFQDTFVVDGIHTTDTADGILGRDGLGGFFQPHNFHFHFDDRNFDFLPEVCSFGWRHGHFSLAKHQIAACPKREAGGDLDLMV
jgi:hypothetical protein